MKLKDKLRSWWIKKRYRKKKILEFNKPPEQATPLIPTVIVDGYGREAMVRACLPEEAQLITHKVGSYQVKCLSL